MQWTCSVKNNPKLSQNYFAHICVARAPTQKAYKDTKKKWHLQMLGEKIVQKVIFVSKMRENGGLWGQKWDQYDSVSYEITKINPFECFDACV